MLNYEENPRICIALASLPPSSQNTAPLRSSPSTVEVAAAAVSPGRTSVTQGTPSLDVLTAQTNTHMHTDGQT